MRDVGWAWEWANWAGRGTGVVDLLPLRQQPDGLSGIHDELWGTRAPVRGGASCLGNTHSTLCVWAARTADWSCSVAFAIKLPRVSNVRRKPLPV